MNEQPEPNNQKIQKPKQAKVFGMLVAEAGLEFPVLIAGPLIAGIFAGKWLDARYSKSFFVIIGILLGLTISFVAIIKRIKDYQNLLKEKNKS